MAITAADAAGVVHRQQGEFVVTDTGVEGSLVYAFSAGLREQIAAQGEATLTLDLLPQHTLEQVRAETRRPRGTRSLSTHLKSRLHLQGVKMGLLHELLAPAQLNDPDVLAGFIKALPLRLAAPRPIDEAISSAGGVRFEALDGAPDGHGRAGPVRCRRDARLGGAHRRLPAHRLPGHRPRRGPGRRSLARHAR